MLLRVCRSRAVLTFLASALLLSGAAAGAPRTTDWPRWRGADFNDSSRASGVFSAPFGLAVRWKTRLGSGYSGIVVADGHAVTMFSDGVRDFLVALDAGDGEELWRVPIAPTYPGRDGANDGPVSTPAIDGGRVFALGPRGDLLAVDLESGDEIWRRRLEQELGATPPHWGFGGSPLVTRDHVVVLTGGAANQAVSAFDRRTGATAWRAGSDDASYQSPLLLERSGTTELLVAGDRSLHVLDPATGSVLRELEHGGAGFYGKILNPVAIAGEGLLLTYRPDEAKLVRLDDPDETIWTTPHLKRNYATPIYHEGYVYGYSGSFLACVDARSGELMWKSREPGNGFPILVDGHLVVQVKDGPLHVVEATPERYRERARIDLFTLLSWTPPSFAAGRIYARDSYGDVAAVDVVPAGGSSDTAPRDSRGLLPGSAFARWVEKTERSPDPEARVRQYLERQTVFPIVEGERRVHIVYEGEVEEIALRGDMLATNEELPMHRVAGTDLYYASFELEPDARVHYQLVRDLEDHLADPRNPVHAASLNYYPGEVSVLFMPRSDRGGPAPDESAAPRRGRLVEVPFTTEPVQVGGKTWGGEREVKVYLPPGYDEDANRRYPTLYVLYGKAVLEHAGLDAALDRAVGTRIEPLVVVFVQAISPYEYARSQREVHGDMMATQLVPQIDGRFRTSPEPSRRAVLGAGEAGYAAVELALRHPGAFGAAAGMSILPIGKGDEELLARIDPRPANPPRFYVDWGRYDVRRAARRIDVRRFSRELQRRLEAAGYSVAGHEWNDGADLAVWGLRSTEAIEALFPALPAR